jgi:hypothetical protein
MFRFMVTAPLAARMRKLRAEGMTFADIGETVGVSTSCARIHTIDVPMPAGYRQKTRRKADPGRVLRGLEAGVSPTMLAARFGVTASRISQIKSRAKHGR